MVGRWEGRTGEVGRRHREAEGAGILSTNWGLITVPCHWTWTSAGAEQRRLETARPWTGGVRARGGFDGGARERRVAGWALRRRQAIGGWRPPQSAMRSAPDRHTARQLCRARCLSAYLPCYTATSSTDRYRHHHRN